MTREAEEVNPLTEIHSNLDKITGERDRLGQVLFDRQTLSSRIGAGQVKVGSSWETTLKVGRVRSRVQASFNRLTERVAGRFADLDIQEQASIRELQDQINLRKDQLTQMRELVDQGALSPEEVAPFQAEFAQMEALSQRYLPQADGQAIGEVGPEHQSGALESLITVDSIPDLMPQMERITSMHEHKYNLANTVKVKQAEAEATDPSLRTDEQNTLLHAVKAMGRYTDSDGYKEVYTPGELGGLVQMLALLSLKNRPDFFGLEDELLAVINRLKGEFYGSSMYDSMKGVIQRATRDEDWRRGMNWETLNSLATVASNFIDEKSKSPEMRSYFVTVKDPEPNQKHDLTPLYQFAADNYTHEVIGKRSIRVDGARQDSFVANCAAVEEWFVQAGPALEMIMSRQGTQQLEEYQAYDSQGSLIVAARLARGCAYQISEMVAAMRERLAGGDMFGKNKDYKIDPAGAISLQLKIAHKASDLRRLIEDASKGSIRPEVIVPLPA